MKTTLLILILALAGCKTTDEQRTAIRSAAIGITSRVLSSAATAPANANWLDYIASRLRAEALSAKTAQDIRAIVLASAPAGDDWTLLSDRVAGLLAKPDPAGIEAVAIGLNDSAASERVP